jgi:hypothetical protein
VKAYANAAFWGEQIERIIVVPTTRERDNKSVFP